MGGEKNYDEVLMPDGGARALGGLFMIPSVFAPREGLLEYEAARVTAPRHYYKYLNGEATSTNPMATIFAWSGALRKRGELDGIEELQVFADRLERASKETIEAGIMTKDISSIADLDDKKVVTTEEFLHAVAERLK